MKAVLARGLPPGRIVDLAHDLRPQGIVEASFLVRAMAERFPAGSVHVVVVDPGVGGARLPLVVACRDGSFLVGPDNGVLVPLADALGGGTAYRLVPERLNAAPRVGTTFDGRDLFSPAAVALSRGIPPRRLGSPTTLTRPPALEPRRRATGAEGAVVHVDRFGNLITNVPTDWVRPGSSSVGVRAGRVRRRLPLVRSYEAAGRGRLAVLGSSFGTLEIAVTGARASDRVGLEVGRRIAFSWSAGGARPARRNRK
jgi:S-adenosyl-L-methionine hydrolase (adenosine-forming)